MTTELDDALARAQRDLAQAREELEATRDPHTEALTARVAGLERETQQTEARAALLEAELAKLKEEERALDAKLDA